MTSAIVGQGDKITLVTKDAVIVCEVVLVRPRGESADDNTEPDPSQPSSPIATLGGANEVAIRVDCITPVDLNGSGPS